jgi:hypothetical protein
MCPRASSPRILKRQTDTVQTLKICKKSLSQVIIAPRAQASRRCETQAPLGGTAAKLCYRFGPLTPSARSANLIAGDGTKNGFPAPNNKLSAQPKQPLDRKSPIQVRIHLSPAASQVRTMDARRDQHLDACTPGGQLALPRSIRLMSATVWHALRRDRDHRAVVGAGYRD